METTIKNKTQWFDKRLKIWYVYDHNRIIERVHYSGEPVSGISITNDRPDQKYTVTGKRKLTHYLANKDILAEFYKSREQDRMTKKFALMMELLVYRVTQMPNFKDYSYNDDFRSESMLVIVSHWRNFDPDKGTGDPNPFAYFTQCVKNASIGVINREKKQQLVRDKLLLSSGQNASHSAMSNTELFG